jgi:hypothetical protein
VSIATLSYTVLTNSDRLIRRIALHERVLKSLRTKYEAESAASRMWADPPHMRPREDNLYNRINRRLTTLENKLESCLLSPCLALCQKMQQTLPRELRDMVYEHILGALAWIVDGKTLGDIKKRPYVPMHGFSKMRHLTNKYCVGTKTKEELAESYYHSTTFVFGGDSADIYQHLKGFLYTVDPWLSVTRIGRLVQHIELQGSDVHMEDRSRIIEELRVLQRATVLHDASVLQKAARRCRIKIVVERFRYSKPADIPRLAGIIGKILPHLVLLVSKGHVVSLEIHPRFAEYLCPTTSKWLKIKGKNPQVTLSSDNLKLETLKQLLRAVG